jgi:hypothetical protein
MAHPEDETYSLIFRSLRHPIRRKILRLLSESPHGFSEMQEALKIESPHLTYHLESLGNLLSKTEDAKYCLSSFGKAAVDVMSDVEEPPKPAMHLQFSPKRWKALLAMLLVGMILLSGLCYLQYRTVTQLSDQYLSLKEQHDALQQLLRESLGIWNAVLTQEYSENGTVATALMVVNKTDELIDFMYEEPLWGHNVDWYGIYSLADNVTLEIEISLAGSDLPAGAYLNIMGWKETGDWSSDSINEPPAGMITMLDVFSLEFWERVNDSATYLMTLPSRGFYRIQVVAPDVWNMTNYYIMNYSMTLRVIAQENQIPFFIENRTQGFRLSVPPDFFDEYRGIPIIGDP